MENIKKLRAKRGFKSGIPVIYVNVPYFSNIEIYLAKKLGGYLDTSSILQLFICRMKMLQLVYTTMEVLSWKN